MKEIINTAIVHCWNLDIPVTVLNIQNVIKEHRGTLQGISRQQIASRIAVYEVQGILGIMEDTLVKPSPEPDPETVKAYEQEHTYNTFIARAAANLDIPLDYFKSWQELGPEGQENFQTDTIKKQIEDIYTLQTSSDIAFEQDDFAASGSFTREANDIQDKLEKQGITIEETEHPDIVHILKDGQPWLVFNQGDWEWTTAEGTN